jgi:uncharacterized membrane protein YdbT with pleckstrin-like domain
MIKQMLIESFDGQKEGEKIVAVWREHPFVFFKSSLVAILIILIGSIPQAFWSPSWGVGFIIIAIGIASIYMLSKVYLWLNTVFILTDVRVFSIYQMSIFSRKTNEVPLRNIQNASHTKAGIAQMTLNFGTVEIQTAGSSTAMMMKDVNNPYQVQQTVLKDLEKLKG